MQQRKGKLLDSKAKYESLGVQPLKQKSTLIAATLRKLIKVHSKIKKQSLSSKQEHELLFLVCLRQGEALLKLLVLELALLPLWSPLPQPVLMSRSRQLQYRLHT